MADVIWRNVTTDGPLNVIRGATSPVLIENVNEDDIEVWVSGEGEVETAGAPVAPTITSIFIVLDEDETDTPITTVEVGQVVRMVVQATGSPAPAVTERAWERDGTPIGGATSATYTVVEDDVGENFLTAWAKVENAAGEDDDESAAIDVVEGEEVLFDDLPGAVTYFGSRLVAKWDVRTAGTMWKGLTTTFGVVAQPGNGEGVSLFLSDLSHASRGSEMLLNPSMATDTEWTKGTGWAHSGSAFTYSGSALANQLVQSVGGADHNNKTYACAFDFSMQSTPNVLAKVRVNAGGLGQNAIIESPGSLANGQSGTVSGFLRLTSYASGREAKFGTNLNYATDWTLHAATLKEVLTISAYQQTGANQPLYSTAGVPHLDFDGAGDVLTGYFPTSLGTDATVVTLTAAGAMTLLANQSISGAYSLPDADWCICMVFEDALTTEEEDALESVLLDIHAGM